MMHSAVKFTSITGVTLIHAEWFPHPDTEVDATAE